MSRIIQVDLTLRFFNTAMLKTFALISVRLGSSIYVWAGYIQFSYTITFLQVSYIRFVWIGMLEMSFIQL